MREAFNNACESMRKTFRAFEDEFIALQQKYPEFHLSFWNHADYLEALESVQSDLHDATTCEWDPEWDGHSEIEPPAFEFRAPEDMVAFCKFMSEYLLEYCDGASGIGWELLKDAAADYLGENTRA